MHSIQFSSLQTQKKEQLLRYQIRILKLEKQILPQPKKNTMYMLYVQSVTKHRQQALHQSQYDQYNRIAILTQEHIWFDADDYGAEPIYLYHEPIQASKNLPQYAPYYTNTINHQPTSCQEYQLVNMQYFLKEYKKDV